MKKIVLSSLMVLMAVIMLASCAIAKTPKEAIKGTWASSSGSEITFNADNTALVSGQTYTYNIDSADSLIVDTSKGMVNKFTISKEKDFKSGEETTWYCDDKILRLGNNVYTRK